MNPWGWTTVFIRTQALLSAITRNAENKLTGWTWASSKAQAVSYDSNGQISGYNLGDAAGTGTAAGVRRTILRDSAGRITAYTHAYVQDITEAASNGQPLGAGEGASDGF